MRCVSRSEMLAAAAELAEEYGESLTLTAFRRETGWSQWAIFDLFGNWKNLRLVVGLSAEAPRTKNRISRERIIALAREQAGLHGEKLTEWMFLRATGLSGRLIADRFGSWGALRELAGLKSRARIQPRYSDADLLEDLYQAWRYAGSLPTYHGHRRRGGKISPQTIRDRFGRWGVVVAAYEAYCRRKEGRLKPLPEGTPWSARRSGREAEGPGDGENVSGVRHCGLAPVVVDWVGVGAKVGPPSLTGG